MESLIPIVLAVIRSCTWGCELEPWKPLWIAAEPQIAARDLMVKHCTKILLYALRNNRELMNYWKWQMSPLIQIRDWSGKQLISRTSSFFSPLSSHGYTRLHRRSRPSRICEQKWSANPSKQLKNNTFLKLLSPKKGQNFSNCMIL